MEVLLGGLVLSEYDVSWIHEAACSFDYQPTHCLNDWMAQKCPSTNIKLDPSLGLFFSGKVLYTSVSFSFLLNILASLRFQDHVTLFFNWWKTIILLNASLWSMLIAQCNAYRIMTPRAFRLVTYKPCCYNSVCHQAPILSAFMPPWKIIWINKFTHLSLVVGSCSSEENGQWLWQRQQQ